MTVLRPLLSGLVLTLYCSMPIRVFADLELYQKQLMERPISQLDLLVFSGNLGMTNSLGPLWEADIKEGWQFNARFEPEWVVKPKFERGPHEEHVEGYKKWITDHTPDLQLGAMRFTFDSATGTFLNKVHLHYYFPETKDPEIDTSKFLSQLIVERNIEGLFKQNRDTFDRLCRWMLGNITINHPIYYLQHDPSFEHWSLPEELEELHDQIRRDTRYVVEIHGHAGNNKIFEPIYKSKPSKSRVEDAVTLSCEETANSEVSISYSGAWQVIEEIYAKE